LKARKEKFPEKRLFIRGQGEGPDADGAVSVLEEKFP